MSRSIPGTSIISLFDNEFGHLMEGTISAIGAGLPTTPATFGTGARIVDRSTSIWYCNRGSVTLPAWEAEPSAITVNLAAADIIGMSAAPVLLIPGIPGKTIVVDTFELVITRTSTAFTGGGVVAPQYSNTATSGGTLITATVATTVITGAAGKTYTIRIPVVQSDVAAATFEGIGVYLSNATSAFAAGTGTAQVRISYHII